MIRKRYWHLKNKWKRHLSLAGHPKLVRHIPPTELLNKGTARTFLKRYRVVYIKPVLGSFGNHILKVTQRKNAYELHRENQVVRVPKSRALEKMIRHARQRKFLIQKGIALLTTKGRPVDYRVLLLKPYHRWEIMGIMGKVASGNRIVTNYSHGGEAIRFAESLRRVGWSHSDILTTRSRMEQLCLTAATKFNERYKHCRRLGVDIGLDADKRIWIIEINTNPAYQLFRHHEDKKLYRKIDRYMNIIRKMQSSKW